ncbi:MAG: TonB-dependent receptor [Gemmatimonadota bacterium]
MRQRTKNREEAWTAHGGAHRMRSRALARTLGCALAVGSALLLAGSSLRAQEGRTLHGRVTDAATGRPILGAEVLANDGVLGRARSDGDGAWELRVPGTPIVRVRVRHPGYAFREFVVDAGRSTAGTPHQTALNALAIPLDAVIVTAARREQKLGDAVVETELIGPRELAQRGASDVAAVLTEHSGMQVDGGVPSGAGVQMRGFDSRRVLILLDGQPMVGRVNGNFDLSRIPTSMVERIEVVKGPQSTLYGSEALGGVVNIITRRATELGWEAGLTSAAGTQRRRDLSANSLWRHGALGATIDGGLRRQELAPGVAGTADTYAHRWNGSGSLRWQPDSGLQLDVGAMAISESQRYRVGQLFHFADNEQWGARASARTAFGGGWLTSTVNLSAFDHLSRASTLAEPVSDSGARDAQRLLQGDLLYNAQRGATQLDAGVQLRRESITADRLSRNSPNSFSVEPFAQLTRTMGQLNVTPGVRVTVSDRWGNFVAPRLAAMWRPVDALAIRGSLGRGFRAPDFKELYLDFVNAAAGYAVNGNPALRPESSNSGSLGVEWTGTALWARGTLFRNDYRNFIEAREPDASGTYTYENIDRGRSAGVELESGLSLRSWQLEGSYDYLHARDLGGGGALLGRPTHSARGSVTGAAGLGVHGNVSLLYTGRTPIDRDLTGAVSRERAGWLRVDARITRSLPFATEGSIGVTNVFDKRLLETWPGFTGRQVVVGMTWHARSGGR